MRAARRAVARGLALRDSVEERAESKVAIHARRLIDQKRCSKPVPHDNPIVMYTGRLVALALSQLRL